MQNHTPPPQVQLMQMVSGFWASCCMYVIAKLNIPDLIADHPKSAGQLAQLTNTHEESLYRVLRALVSINVLTINDQQGFSLAPMGETLRSNMPGSMKAMVVSLLGDHFGAWGNLLHSVKTGETAFDHVHQKDIWQYYNDNPDDGANFTKAMMDMTMGAMPAILQAYDFTQFNTIADVGGGNGTLLCGILTQVVNAKGIVFDGSYVATSARDNINAYYLEERCHFHEGNFFDKVDVTADAFILKRILHDWNDEKAIAILRNVANALTSGNKLLIMETVLPTDNSPHPGKFLDINMMVMTGGKERTELEWRLLIDKAGLKLKAIYQTEGMMGIIETEKV